MSLILKYAPRVTGRSMASNEDHAWVELGFTYKKTPSWLRYGDGSGNIEFRASLSTGGLSIDASEHNHAGNGSSKNVMLQLDRAEALLLRDMLKRVLGE